MAINRNILKEQQDISILTLNKMLYNAYDYMNSAEIASPSLSYSTTSISGVVTFADSLSSINPSGISLGVSPYTLHSTPKVLSEYYNNDITGTISNSTNTINAKYVILANKNIMIFGSINTPQSSLITINFTEMFASSPYFLEKLYHINISNNQLKTTQSPASIITSIIQESDILVKFTGDTIDNNYPTSNIVLRWFAIGKVK